MEVIAGVAVAHLLQLGAGQDRLTVYRVGTGHIQGHRVKGGEHAHIGDDVGVIFPVAVTVGGHVHHQVDVEAGASVYHRLGVFCDLAVENVIALIAGGKDGILGTHTDAAAAAHALVAVSYTHLDVYKRQIQERPDAILNIIDGTNLERNLYLTTQLMELGLPVVVAVNMMDVVRRSGDKLNTKKLSETLGCPVVEISALKGDGIKEAADAAVKAAAGAGAVPLHRFSGTVEHALAHIEELALHKLPEEQQRWYAVKLFERDEKIITQLGQMCIRDRADLLGAQLQLVDHLAEAAGGLHAAAGAVADQEDGIHLGQDAAAEVDVYKRQV